MTLKEMCEQAAKEYDDSYSLSTESHHGEPLAVIIERVAKAFAEKAAFHAVHQILASVNIYRSPDDVTRYIDNAIAAADAPTKT